jgi:hypothetical protein
MVRLGIIGVGAATLLQELIQWMVAHGYHWSQVFHFFAQLGDILSAGATLAVAYLTYRLLKLQLDGPPSAPLVRATGRAVECNQYLEN